MQHVVNGALHCALHRAFPGEGNLPGEHLHRTTNAESSERFGSLYSTGPFPVCGETGHWYFPRPLDLGRMNTTPSMLPMLEGGGSSSAHRLLRGPVVNCNPPDKESENTLPWLSKNGWENYLTGGSAENGEEFAANDRFYDVENAVGIGIDPERGSVREGLLYSAEYMRLREDAHLGVLARMPMKNSGSDGLDALFPKSDAITVGGQSRVCRVQMNSGDGSCLPRGPSIEGNRVKWTLLTPCIFQPLGGTHHHPGGWIPTWIHPSTGEVELLDGPGKGKASRMGTEPGSRLKAKLVSTRLGSPEAVTGWKDHARQGRPRGARSTLLAVPAGSVYYFEAEDNEQARKLASALSWHGAQNSTEIINRRSGLLGEKGYGLGVCSEWKPYSEHKL